MNIVYATSQAFVNKQYVEKSDILHVVLTVFLYIIDILDWYNFIYMKEKRKFRDIFKEDKDEKLTLLSNIIVKGEKFTKDQVFALNETIGGVDFHKFRYLDLAVEVGQDGVLTIVGFYPSEN